MKYEAWITSDKTQITCGTATDIEENRRKGLLGEEFALLYEIEAATYEEAMAVHHIRMGWEPYKPVGTPEECPNGCGAIYYPKGTGWCRICGPVG